MLDEVLRNKGYVGEGVGEMLKSASFKTVSLAWDAHKIRNRIAHEGSDFQLTEREAKKAFTLYESVFRELKAIK
jgi:NAD+--asparagine ADP-ribosyltransferase